MKVNGRSLRTIWCQEEGRHVAIIDQTRLPHDLEIKTLSSLDEAAEAIRVMRVRGAPLIGACAAYGMALALSVEASKEAIRKSAEILIATRPTASNLRWAVERICQAVETLPESQRARKAWAVAEAICEEDVQTNQAIGRHGLAVIEKVATPLSCPVHILTHCNAGWLATVDMGTALAPVYLAHDAGLAVHVFVSETRPRNQGTRLTAWELASHGVPHTVIADNAAGHLMQNNQIDFCIVGTDRVAANGDVCNKIGTYLKALAAHDCGVPFYVALPGSTIDWSCPKGADIPIEERDHEEVSMIEGSDENGTITQLRIGPEGTCHANPAFDVTPSHLVTGFITERGICPANSSSLQQLYPEYASGNQAGKVQEREAKQG